MTKIVSVIFRVVNFHLSKNQELHITKGLFKGSYDCSVYLKTSSGEGFIADFSIYHFRNATEVINLMISGEDDLEFKTTFDYSVASRFTGFIKNC